MDRLSCPAILKNTPKKILIANRGEIALRILRTAKSMGYRVLSVYSDVDQFHPHVTLADESVCVGPAPSTESYLRAQQIVDLAVKHQCWGVHPGYGFLSENAAFAQALTEKGIVFIGPSPKTISDMGDKVSARALAAQARVPMIPGTQQIDDPKKAEQKAAEIGFPVLIKAKAGGGGKGMRVVHQASEFASAFEMARSEALKAFGDGGVYLEKYLLSPRHVEIQVFADHHGNVATFFDRDCSIQRRHQKIIEEAPAPFLSDATKEKMKEVSIQLCNTVDYRGAGTLEFLVDQQQQFYFLEMNTRLQVEHPVTEWVTGLDLVELQIRAAENEVLSLESQCQGHSIEARIYAEDCKAQFAPSPGKITQLKWPSGPFVRVDSHIEKGSEISLFYDPMIAKISTWGPTRDKAIERMIQALHEFHIEGVMSNRDFLLKTFTTPAFATQAPTTNFIEKEKLLDESGSHNAKDIALAFATAALSQNHAQSSSKTDDKGPSLWWTSGIDW
ncbi:MAG: biotin carboxylase N-terminal domain-containing protein [Bdellovibrionota bacterium]